MSNITKGNSFSLTPTNLEEAMKLADVMAKSSVIPKNYQGKPGDILVAVQMGAEVGLAPTQALQNIAVINGNPSVWGDAAIALVRSHPGFENMREYIKDDTAYCEIKRKGQDWHVSSFSKTDANRAGLWNKPGPWKTYPNRMLQMRARGFAIRDVFPDALKGLITAEEAMDYPSEEKDISSESKENNTTQRVSSKLDNLLNVEETQPTPEEQSDENELLQKLHELIMEKPELVPDNFISNCLNKAGVERMEDLSDDQLQACINYIENKSQA